MTKKLTVNFFFLLPFPLESFPVLVLASSLHLLHLRSLVLEPHLQYQRHYHHHQQQQEQQCHQHHQQQQEQHHHHHHQQQQEQQCHQHHHQERVTCTTLTDKPVSLAKASLT